MGIKYPRVIVSKKRHAQLTKEARARKSTIEIVAEEKFKSSEK